MTLAHICWTWTKLRRSMWRNGREIPNFGIVDSKIKIHFYTALTENKSKSNASTHFNASQPAASSTERTMSATPNSHSPLAVNERPSSFCWLNLSYVYVYVLNTARAKWQFFPFHCAECSSRQLEVDLKFCNQRPSSMSLSCTVTDGYLLRYFVTTYQLLMSYYTVKLGLCKLHSVPWITSIESL